MCHMNNECQDNPRSGLGIQSFSSLEVDRPVRSRTRKGPSPTRAQGTRLGSRSMPQDNPHDVIARASFPTALFSGLFLSLLIPVVLVGVTDSSSAEGKGTYQLVVLILAGLRFAWLLGSSRRHLYETTIWLFIYVFLGMAPFIQQRLAIDPSTTPNVSQEYVNQASAVVIVGCIALMLGSYFGSRWGLRTVAPSPRVSPRRVRLFVGSMILISSYYIFTIGVGNFFISRTDFGAVRVARWPDTTVAVLISGIVTMGLLVAFIALMQLGRENAVHGKKPARATQILILILLLVCVNPISSPRYVFGTVALAILGALGAYSSLAKFRLVAGGAMVALVFAFPAADAFRRTTEASLGLETPLQSMLAGDFDAFAQIVNTIELVASEGITWGYQALGVALFWVPSSLWGSKPLDSGIVIADFKGYEFTNLSAPLWAEFYLNFGWAGVGVGMLLVGYLARRLDESSELSLRLHSDPSILACILPFYSLILLRGSLLQAVAYASVAVLCARFVSEKRSESTFVIK